ncbi:MAG: phosphoglucosamine mutase [Elusimicrobiota bacterium]
MKKLFGTDGIRGIAGEYPLVPKLIKKIGYIAAIVLSNKARKKMRGFIPISIGMSKPEASHHIVAENLFSVSEAKRNEIVLGKDTRESSGWISKIICEGITSAGVNVFDCGVISTPAVSYIASKRKSIAGCVISASHNPSEFNGIKFFSNDGIKIADQKELEIEKLVLGTDLHKQNENKIAGKILYRDTTAEKQYLNFLLSTVKPVTNLSQLKIVVDCANGSNYKTAAQVFDKLKANTTVIFNQPDGKNINHNCGSLHLKTLQKTVVEQNADFGIAFDGDGDRCIFVDDEGEIRDGDYLIAIAANYLKKNNALKNNGLIATVMANFGFYKMMEKLGINVFTCAVGDKYVFEQMLKNDVILGGEQSGHIIFRNFLNTGDGLLTALQITSIIHKTVKPLSELAKIIKKYPQVLLNVKVEKKLPITENKKLSDTIKNVEQKLKDNGRVLIRYSGTEPLLRIMVEGPDNKIINQYAQEIASAVNL